MVRPPAASPSPKGEEESLFSLRLVKEVGVLELPEEDPPLGEHPVVLSLFPHSPLARLFGIENPGEVRHPLLPGGLLLFDRNVWGRSQVLGDRDVVVLTHYDVEGLGPVLVAGEAMNHSKNKKLRNNKQS